MIKNFVKILELLGDRLEVCVSVCLLCMICTEIKIQTLSRDLCCISALFSGLLLITPNKNVASFILICKLWT